MQKRKIGKFFHTWLFAHEYMLNIELVYVEVYVFIESNKSNGKSIC